MYLQILMNLFELKPSNMTFNEHFVIYHTNILIQQENSNCEISNHSSQDR